MVPPLLPIQQLCYLKMLNTLYGALVTDIDKHYEKHPVIIISDNVYRDRLLNHFNVSKMKHAEGG